MGVIRLEILHTHRCHPLVPPLCCHPLLCYNLSCATTSLVLQSLMCYSHPCAATSHVLQPLVCCNLSCATISPVLHALPCTCPAPALPCYCFQVNPRASVIGISLPLLAIKPGYIFICLVTRYCFVSCVNTNPWKRPGKA